MALIDSKQLNPRFTGSFTLSGSRQTFIGPTTFTGSIIASGNISGSLTSILVSSIQPFPSITLHV